MSRSTLPLHLALAATALALPACFPAPVDDAGDEAFASEAVRIVEGRRPTSPAELAYFAEVAATQGREALVDLLLAGDGFVTHWAQLLPDILEVPRGTSSSFPPGCFEAPLLDPAHYPALVHHLRTAPPTAPFCLGLPHEPPDGPGVAPDPLGALAEAEVVGVRGEDAPPAAPIPTLDAEPGPAPGPDAELEPPRVPLVAPVVDLLWPEPPIEAPLCPGWNLTDLTRAAIAEDALDVLLQAHLVAMALHPESTGSERAVRDAQGAQFLRTYVGRDVSCLSCHTSTYSTTDGRPRNGDFDRSHPVGALLPSLGHVDLEGGAFSHDLPDGSVVYGGLGGRAAQRGVSNLFRGDQRAASGGLRPWGLAAACAPAGLVTALPSDPLGNGAETAGFAGAPRSATAGVLALALQLRPDASDPPGTPQTLVQGPLPAAGAFDGAAERAARCDGCHTQGVLGAPAWSALRPDLTGDDIVAAIRSGVGDMPPQSATISLALAREIAFDVTRVSRCDGCHGTANTPAGQAPDALAPTWSQLLPGLSPFVIERTVREGSATGLMPPIRPFAADAQNRAMARAIARFLATDPAFGGQTRIVEHPHRADAFKALVALHLADRVTAQISGAPLTVEHGQPRNGAAQRALASLAQALRAGGGWSLRAVVRAVTLSPAVARRAPAASTLGPDALPPIINPWVQTSAPVGPPAGNDVGDGVHRARIPALLAMVHRALEWPAPRVMAHGSAWPDRALSRALGRHQDLAHPGSDTLSLGALLAWEEAIGDCEKPTAFAEDVALRNPNVVRPPGTLVDGVVWVDAIERLAQRTDLDMQQAVATLKLRLTGEGFVTPDEAALMEQLTGVPMDDPPDEAALRTVCGVILRSPQFLLVGLAPEDDSTGGAGAACLTPPCDRQAACDQHDDTLEALGYGRVCP